MEAGGLAREHGSDQLKTMVSQTRGGMGEAFRWIKMINVNRVNE